MDASRRTFLKTTAAAGGALAAGLAGNRPLAGADGTAATPGDPSNASRRPPPPRNLRILVLGGTSFIGPHQVEYAMSRGHEVTLFNRGRTNTHLFPGLEKLVGDRNGDLTALEGRSWDVVIDNSATNPRWVELSAGLLKDTCERYIFVSTRSVYADTSRVPMTIAAPVWTYERAGVEPGAERLPYGLSKALAEQNARDAFGEDRAMVFRPGLIIGPGDTTDRFTYWPVRIHRGGEVLAPGDGTDPVQIIDVRDFGEWLVEMAEAGESGTYNVVGPRTPRPMAELLYGIRAVTTAETTFTWVDTDFVINSGLATVRRAARVEAGAGRGGGVCAVRPHARGGEGSDFPVARGHDGGDARVPFLASGGAAGGVALGDERGEGAGGAGSVARVSAGGVANGTDDEPVSGLSKCQS